MESEGGYFAETITLGVLMLAIAGGAGLFFRNPVAMTLGPIAGLAAGLGSRDWRKATAVGGLAVLVGAGIASLVSRPSWGPVMGWFPDVLLAAIVAAVLAGLVCAAIKNSERLRPLIAAVAVAAVIGVMSLSAIALATIPASGNLSTFQLLARTPAYGPQMGDSDLYLIWAAELRSGKSYYPMAVDSFVRANAVRPDAPLPVKSPLSYRLPTLYALLGALPPNGVSYVLAMMVVCAIGVVSAYLLARQFVSQPVALAGAILVAALFSGYGSYALLDTESWAGALGLAAVAGFVASRTQPKRTFALQMLAVVLALGAAAFREIAAPFLLLGLVASFADAELRATRAWIAWAVGLALAIAAIAAHWMAAAAAYSSVTTRAVESSWFSPNGAGLLGAVSESAIHVWVFPVVVWVLIALGIVGSAVATRDLATRIMLAGVAAGGPLVLLFVHPPGETNFGGAPGYWGALVIPAVFACVPLAFALLEPVRRGAPASSDAHH